MGGYQLKSEERETVILFNAADKGVEIDTADPVVIRKLDKLCEQFPEVYSCVREDEKYQAKSYTIVSKKLIRFGKPATEKQKETGRKLAERLLKSKNAESDS